MERFGWAGICTRWLYSAIDSCDRPIFATLTQFQSILRVHGEKRLPEFPDFRRGMVPCRLPMKQAELALPDLPERV